MHKQHLPLRLLCVVLLLAAATAQAGDKTDVTLIPVSQPIKREVTDYADFTGRIEAVTCVEIRARATGYLLKTAFKEGGEVREGDLLFEIDPRPYQAELDQAGAALALSETRLKQLNKNLQQTRQLVATGAVSRDVADKLVADVAEADAGLRTAKAAVTAARLKLSFTKVHAPCAGVIGRSRLSPGNLVKADDTLLAEIVSQDPMYAYFAIDEVTFLRLRRAVNAGKRKPLADGQQRLLLALAGDTGFPHAGVVNFVDSRVSPNTADIAARGVFANPKGPGGERLMVPGMSARVRLPLGEPHPALLVTDRAILTEPALSGEDERYVYVVDAQNDVQYRRVKTGALQDDGLRVIADGLKTDDWVVVGGMTELKPRTHVRPKRIPMPVLQTTPAPKTGAAKAQNSELRKELLDRVRKDQDARRAVMALMHERKQDDPQALRKLDQPAVKQLQEIDRDNTAWLKAIVKEKGWPGKSLVGTDGAHAAWLLVQHADHDRPFQKQCLELIRAAFQKGETTGEQVAYLADRVRVGEKQKQLYGTQLRVVDGKYAPQPIEDEGRVDERRKQMGMMPLADYLRFAEMALKAAGKKGQ